MRNDSSAPLEALGFFIYARLSYGPRAVAEPCGEETGFFYG